MTNEACPSSPGKLKILMVNMQLDGIRIASYQNKATEVVIKAELLQKDTLPGIGISCQYCLAISDRAVCFFHREQAFIDIPVGDKR